MSVLAPLLDKLDFIRWFYETASAPFAETIRKIEMHEEPYSQSSVEDEEPRFLLEHEEATDALNILGKSCICLLQNSFRNYLTGFVENYAYRTSGDETGRSTLNKGNWFKNHKEFFLRMYGIDWDNSPVDTSLLEEIAFVRNDVQHGGTFYSLEHHQNAEYFNRFPSSIFADEWEREFLVYSDERRSVRITITKDNLLSAIQVIEDFCSYLDADWWEPSSPQPS